MMNLDKTKMKAYTHRHADAADHAMPRKMNHDQACGDESPADIA